MIVLNFFGGTAVLSVEREREREREEVGYYREEKEGTRRGRQGTEI
jgi:hypothetical protein